MMNRVLLLSLFVVLSFSLVGCRDKENNPQKSDNNIQNTADQTEVTKPADLTKATVLPPARYGEGDASIEKASYAYGFSIETAAAELDFVGRIRIGNWLGEAMEGTVTCFEAEVVKQLKGEPVDKIVFLQAGGSKSLPAKGGNILYQAGDEFLIFANKIHNNNLSYENAYCMVTPPDNLLYWASDSEGHVYYLDFTGALGSLEKQAKNITGDAELRLELKKNIRNMDPELAEIVMKQTSTYLFDADEIDAIISEFKDLGCGDLNVYMRNLKECGSMETYIKNLKEGKYKK